jgi:hypothetical protein
MSPSPSHRGYRIQFLNGISGIESSRNWTEFRPIPKLSDHHVTLTLTPWLLHPIPERNSGNWVERESDGIPCNSYRFRNQTEFRFDPILEFPELIPRAELIPQCSTLRNRMTARKSLTYYSHLRTRPRYWWDNATYVENFMTIGWAFRKLSCKRPDRHTDRFYSVLTFWVHKKVIKQKSIRYIPFWF